MMCENGVTWREAIIKYGDPELVIEFEKLQGMRRSVESSRALFSASVTLSGDASRYETVQNQLIESVLSQLHAGEVPSWGYRPNDLKVRRIPNKLWYSLRPNLDESSASSGDLCFLGITIGGSEPNAAKVPTTKDEMKYAEFIKKEYQSDNPPRIQAEAFDRLKKQFPDEDIGPRPLLRAWEKGAPEAAKYPGRKGSSLPPHNPKI